MKEIKVNKKVKYSIRMLIWHTKLANRNYEIVKKWMENNKIDYNDNLLKYVGKNEERKDEKQLTIFDFIN